MASMAVSPRFGEQWLNQHQLGYVDLDGEDRTAMREFALLWSIFELQALFGDSRVEAMIGYVDEFANVAKTDCKKLLAAPFIPHLTYFREQFVDAERLSTNDLFESMQFQESDHKELVSHALIKLNDETPELIKALLIIVHRFRDGLFRGLKWYPCSKKQRDDLYHASKILMKAADISMP